MNGVALFLVIVVGLGVAGCKERTADSLDKLPKSVGGEVLLYNVSHGAQSEPWAEDVLRSTGLPDSALTSATGFTKPGDREYQSYVVRVEGADGRALLRPLVDTFGIFENIREETLAGKTVLRYDVRSEGQSDWSVAVAYSFDDVAIAILARRPQEAAEALNAMP